MTLKKLEQAIEKNFNKIYSGAGCVFVPITKTIGAKLYPTLRERDFAYRNQNRALKLKIAPKTYGTFKLPRPSNWDILEYEIYCEKPFKKTVYGYLTEIVKVSNIVNWNDPARLELEETVSEKLGFRTGDLIGANLGWKKNKLIMIDFDSFSIA